MRFVWREDLDSSGPVAVVGDLETCTTGTLEGMVVEVDHLTSSVELGVVEEVLREELIELTDCVETGGFRDSETCHPSPGTEGQKGPRLVDSDVQDRGRLDSSRVSSSLLVGGPLSG